MTDNEDNHTMNDKCNLRSKNSDTDCKKEGFRDELMTIKGEMKILNQQNHNFLCKLKSAVMNNSKNK
jgi:hypothetical protein